MESRIFLSTTSLTNTHIPSILRPAECIFNCSTLSASGMNVKLAYGSALLFHDLKIHSAGRKIDGICVFVNDVVDKKILDYMKKHGMRAVLNRCAGFDKVDAVYADKVGIQVCRVPAYSPYAVAEHAVSLLLTLNRKLHVANNRTCVGNFTIDGLTGMDLRGKTVGLVGTGKIGQIFGNIMLGFGCKINCFDVFENPEFGSKPNVEYMSLDDVWKTADVISLHSPLLPSTKHMVNKSSLKKMKPGVVIINCARGGLINTEYVLDAMNTGVVSALGIDVYEHEAGVFFNDLSRSPGLFQDKTLATLMSRPNVLISAHQAFLTEEALDAIAKTTLINIKQICRQDKKGEQLDNWVSPAMALNG